MATIPQYKPQVRREPIPGVRQQVNADANIFGAGLYGAQGQLAKQAYEIGEAQQKQQDEKIIMDALNEFNRTVQDFSYSDDENKPGFLQTAGYNAQGITKSFEGNLYAHMEKKIYPMFKTREQADRFHQITTPMFLKTIGTYRQHENSQVIKANINKANSTSDLAIGTALSFDMKQNVFNPIGLKSLQSQLMLSADSIYPGQSQEAKTSFVRKQLTEKYGEPLLTHFSDPTNINVDALDAMEKHGEEYFDPVFLEKVRQVRGRKTSEDKFQADLYSIRNNPQLRDTNGDLDLTKVEVRAKELYGERIESMKGGMVGGLTPIESKIEPLVQKYAKMYNLNPHLFRALIKQESGFQEGIVSSVGAIGYAQLMPGTARQLGVDPNDAEQNIEGGARYLRQMLDEFGQNEKLALAGYNAGPGNARTALSEGWKETVGHGQSILTHKADYESRATAQASRTIPADYKKIEAMVNSAKAIKRDEAMEKAQREHDELIRVKDLIATAPSIEAAITGIRDSSILKPHQKSQLENALISNRPSDQTTVLALIDKKAFGTLTDADVNSVANRLSRSDLEKYYTAAAEIKAGKVDKMTQQADQALLLAIKQAEGDKDKEARLKHYVFTRLDDEGLAGWARDSRGRALVEEYKKGKAPIYQKYTEVKTKWGWLYQTWGDQLIDAVYEGQIAMGAKEFNPYEAENLLMSIDQNDAIQMEAKDELLRNRKPLTLLNMNIAIKEISRERSVTPKYIQYSGNQNISEPDKNSPYMFDTYGEGRFVR